MNVYSAKLAANYNGEKFIHGGDAARMKVLEKKKEQASLISKQTKIINEILSQEMDFLKNSDLTRNMYKRPMNKDNSGKD